MEKIMTKVTLKNRFGKKIEYVILQGLWKQNSRYGQNGVDPNGKLGPKAMLFLIGEKKEWFPISQCIIDQVYSNEDHGYTHEIKIPVWLYNKKFNQ
jgi:hypothetical protein